MRAIVLSAMMFALAVAPARAQLTLGKSVLAPTGIGVLQPNWFSRAMVGDVLSGYSAGPGVEVVSGFYGMIRAAPVGVQPMNPQSEPSLKLAGSNPCRGNARILFHLPARASVTLAVYDLGGRLVRELHRGELPAGSHVSVWDLVAGSGWEVPAGVYFCRLESGASRGVLKLIVVR